MELKKYFEIIHLAEKLKNTTRHCVTSAGRTESVAEHSWRAALMAYFLKDEFPKADINKVILMCIFHDMGEAFTGDIPTFEKNKNDEKKENEILYDWINSLPRNYSQELKELFDEMNEQQTVEAKIYKAIDKTEAVIQHNESPISSWLELEYELQKNYGKENCEFSEYMKNFRSQILDDTNKKIQEGK